MNDECWREPKSQTMKGDGIKKDEGKDEATGV